MIRRRWLVLAACAGLCLLALASISRGVLATSIGAILLGDNPRYETYREATRRFGGDQAIVVGVDDPEILAPERRARLQPVLERLAAFPEVARVESVYDARRLVPQGFGPPQVARWADGVPGAEQARARLAELATDPDYGGVLVGRDGRSSLVIAQFEAADDRPAEALPELVGRVAAALHTVYPPEAVHLVGTPVVLAEVLRQTASALALTTPVVALVLLATVWVLFRRLWPAALSLAVAGIAALWTMGIAVALDPNVNMLTAFVPALMLIIAFSDVVHLCSAYLIELEQQPEKEQAVVAACAEVGRACLFTSLTTGLGFLCLSLIPTPAFRVLGVALGLGVGLALLLAVTLTPILLHLMPRPKPLRAGATAGAQAAIDTLLGRCERLATQRPRAVLLAFGLATVLAGAAASRLTIETDFSKRISADNPVSQDQAWFDARFVGASLIQLYVDAPDALSDPAWFRALARLRDQAQALPEVERVLSWVELVERVFQATGGQLQPDARLPKDDPALEQLLRLVLHQDIPELRRLVDREGARVRLIVNVSSQGLRANGEVARRLEQLAASTPGVGAAVATGLNPLLGQWLDEVVAAQRNGVVVSIVIIALVMVVGLRSLRVGLVSMLPNLFPLLVIVGCLGALWEQVDSDCIALTFVALGIGVDDTIHFLSRLRLEVSRPGEGTAIARTFGFAGRGIVMTTVILALGFLPLLLSDYFLMRMFGSLLPLCMVVALIADLLLVPAMAQLGWLRFAPPPQVEPGSA